MKWVVGKKLRLRFRGGKQEKDKEKRVKLLLKKGIMLKCACFRVINSVYAFMFAGGKIKVWVGCGYYRNTQYIPLQQGKNNPNAPLKTSPN